MSVQSQNDAKRAQKLLIALGYILDGDIDVHTQFMLKYKKEFENKPSRKRAPYKKHTRKKRKNIGE